MAFSSEKRMSVIKFMPLEVHAVFREDLVNFRIAFMQGK